MTDETRDIRMQVMWNRLISVVEEQAMTGVTPTSGTLQQKIPRDKSPAACWVRTGWP